ncbi:MAG TPA: HAMP domain-containing sensor histidine kinase, partial [Streptosporangiaceae bacterium]|nr:HAMP domain-containing sensor histidine kinase [Streptosporangiaceae bacterium]
MPARRDAPRDRPLEPRGPGGAAPRRSVLARWLAGRTLRARLIAGLLVLFTLASVGVGIATTIALRGFLVGQLDQQLRAAQGLSPAVEHQGCHGNAQAAPGGPGFDNRPPAGEPAGTLVARLKGGQLTDACLNYAGTGLAPLTMAAADVTVLQNLPVNNQPHSCALAALGDYRLVAMAGSDGDIHVTGLPLHNVNSTVQRLEIIEIIVFGATLVIIGLAGTGWVRLSLRPLRRVTATAAEVTELPLATGEVTLPHRVPDADPRTEVGQLGEAFNRMLGHVEQALGTRQASEARLRQFIADASHELRTPLAGIRGYTELALRRDGELDPELRHSLSRVDAESARMSRLVDDLLLLARLDAGRPLAHDAVDLTRLAIDVTNDAHAAGPEHRWVLDLPDEPVTVTGDEHRLHQVLANLLTNARAHTPPGSTVTVRLIPAGTG